MRIELCVCSDGILVTGDDFGATQLSSWKDVIELVRLDNYEVIWVKTWPTSCLSLLHYDE